MTPAQPVNNALNMSLLFFYIADESYHSIGGLMGGPGGGGGGYATTGSIGATAGSGGDAVDECGLRFLLAMRHHTCLMRSLPPKHRAVLEEKVIWRWGQSRLGFFLVTLFVVRAVSLFYCIILTSNQT